MAFTLEEAVVSLKSTGLDKLVTDLRQPKTQLDRIAQSAQKAESAIGGVGKKKVGDIGANALVGDLNKVTRKFADIEQGISGLGIGGTSSLGRLASGLSAVTGSAGLLAVAIGAAGAVAFGVVATQAAARLQTNMANVATISKDVAQNFEKVTRQVSDLAVAANTKSNLLSVGLYQTISSGITDTADAMIFLEASANAAKAGLTSVEIAVDGLSSVTNAFGLQASQVTEISDKFFKAVELGKFSFGELASSIGMVAPLASSLGVSIDDLLASGAALTLTGLSLSESFTGVRGILTELLKPTDEAKAKAAELGIQFDSAALRTKGLVGFLSDLKNTTGLNVDAMGILFGRIEGLNAALALTGNQADTASKFLGEIKNSAGATNNALEIIKKTLDDNVALMKNEWNRLLEKAGLELLPAVTAGVKAWGRALHVVNELLKENIELRKIPVPALPAGPVQAQPILPPAPLGETVGERRRRFAQPPITFGKEPPIKPGALPRGFVPGVGEMPPEFGLRFSPQAEILRAERPIPTRRPPIVPPFMRGLTIEPPEGIFKTQTLDQQVENSIEQFKDWQAAAENAYASAGVSLQTFLVLLERQGVAVVDGLPLIPQQTEAWKKAFGIITPLQIKNVENIRKQGNSITALIGILGKGSVNIGNAFKVTGDAITKTINDGIKDIQKQNAVFLGFTAEIEDRGIQAQASLLEAEGKSLEARLLLLDHELARKKEAIDKDVKNHAAADRLKTELTKAGTQERIAIIRGELKGLMPPTPPGEKPLDLSNLSPKELETAAKTLRDIQGLREAPVDFRGMPFTPTGQEAQEEPTEQLTGMAAIMNEVKEAGTGIGRSFRAIDNAIQGGKAGGAVGAITAFGISLLMETEGFKQIMEMVSKLFGSLVKILEPIMKALANTLGPVFDLLGAILEPLAPLFELLGQAIELLLTPIQLLANAIRGLIGWIGDFLGLGGEAFGADLPIDERKAAEAELARRGQEFRRLRDAGQLPADIAALPPAMQLAAFVKRGGPIRVDVNPAGKQPVALGGIKAGEAAQAEKPKEAPTQGIQISQITGPTRDILVAALSPLKQLDTTFPAMLDELKLIRGILSGKDGEGKPIVDVNAAPARKAPVIQLPEGVKPGFDMFPMQPALNMPQAQPGEFRNADFGLRNLIRNPQFDMFPMQPALNMPQAQPGEFRNADFGLRNLIRNPQSEILQGPLIQIPRFARQPEVNMPDFARFQGMEHQDVNPDAGFVSANGDSISIMGGITIQVQQVTDISIEEIDRQLQRELTSHRRAVGNRGRVTRIA